MHKLVFVCLIGCAAAACHREPSPVRPLTAEESAAWEKQRREEQSRAERFTREDKYREAHEMLELALQKDTPPFDREFKLMFVIDTLFHLLPEMEAVSADLDRALQAMLETDAADNHFARYVIELWDAGDAHRLRLRPVLEKMRAAHLAVLTGAKFDLRLRYRDEDVARYVRTKVYRTDADSPNYCSAVSGNIEAMYQISHRLAPDAPDTRAWMLHRTDLILYHWPCDGVGDAYQGEEAYREAYGSYLELGRIADAARVVREAADESLGYYVWGNTFVGPEYGGTKPEEPEYLEHARAWLAKLPAAEQAAIVRKNADAARKDDRPEAAEKILELLGERPDNFVGRRIAA